MDILRKARWSRLVLLLGLTLFASIALIACSDDGEGDGDTTETATATEGTGEASATATEAVRMDMATSHGHTARE